MHCHPIIGVWIETMKTGRGGARSGAGRPKGTTKNRKVNITVRIKPELMEKVKEQEIRFASKSELVEKAIEKFLK